MNNRLYGLLPEIYRTYDAGQGRPLEALLATLQIQYDAIEANIAALYDAWFVETCPQWAVPYIGALLGVRGLDSAAANLPRQRARVGNTQLYRGRKGVMAVLANAAGDASGWPAVASDSLDRLVCSQDLCAGRPARNGSARLSGAETATWIDTPFSKAPRAAGFRKGADGPIAPGRATLSLWRIRAQPLEGVTPAPGPEPQTYTFSPHGVDTPLFTLPETPTDLFRNRTAAEVPLALSSRRLAGMIARRRAGDTAPEPFAVHVRQDGAWRRLPLEAFAVMDLALWGPPPAQVRWGRGPTDVATIEAGVDPERGRLVLAAQAEDVVVDYVYGFGLDIGGGPYDRRARMTPQSAGTWSAVVASEGPGRPAFTAGPGIYSTLEQALADWGLVGLPGRVTIADNATYAWPTTPLAIVGRSLIVEAANGCRPCIRDDLHVQAGAADEGSSGLTLDGLCMRGRITATGDIRLRLQDCTVRPDGGLAFDLPDGATQPSPKIEVAWCIVGSMVTPVGEDALKVEDSIVDGSLPPTARVSASASTPTATIRPNALTRTTELGDTPWVTPQGAAPALSATAAPADSGRAWAVAAATYGQPAYARPLERRVVSRDQQPIGQAGAYYSVLQGQRVRNLDPVADEFLAQWLTLHVDFAD